MKSIKSVLITEASQKNALACVRSLGKEGLKVYVIAHHYSDVSRFSRFCSGSLVIDKLESKVISNYIKDNNIDLVMPIGTTSMEFLSKNKTFFNKECRFLIPNESQIKLAMSKKETMKIAEDLNIPVPKTFFPNSIQEAEKHANIIGFPCVMKWIYEVGENLVDYANNIEEFSQKYSNMCKKYDFNNETGFPMVQEYIDGIGVGYFALFYKGLCIDSYQHERIREAPPSGGVSVCAKTVDYDNLRKYGELLLSNLKWSGVAMVEFKKLKDDKLVLMEINPKFWGSLDLGIKAGANLPLSIINTLNAEDSDVFVYQTNYHKNLRFQWPLDGDIKYMFVSLPRFFSVLKDIVNPRVKSNLNFLNDPMPTIVQITSIIFNFFKGWFK